MWLESRRGTRRRGRLEEREGRRDGEGRERKGRYREDGEGWLLSESVIHLREHLYFKRPWIPFLPKVQSCYRCLLSSAGYWFVTVWRPNWNWREGELCVIEQRNAQKKREKSCLLVFNPQKSIGKSRGLGIACCPSDRHQNIRTGILWHHGPVSAHCLLCEWYCASRSWVVAVSGGGGVNHHPWLWPSILCLPDSADGNCSGNWDRFWWFLPVHHTNIYHFVKVLFVFTRSYFMLTSCYSGRWKHLDLPPLSH